MPTKLCIQVSSVSQPKKLEVEFMYNEEWTADAEVLLLQRIHEILSLYEKIDLQSTGNNPSDFNTETGITGYGKV